MIDSINFNFTDMNLNDAGQLDSVTNTPMTASPNQSNGSSTVDSSPSGQSGSSANSGMPMVGQRPTMPEDIMRMLGNTTRNRSLASLDNLDNVMRDFRMNGADAELENQFDSSLGAFGGLLGGGLPPSSLSRQTSWPSDAFTNTLENFYTSLSAANEYAAILSREQHWRQLLAQSELMAVALQARRRRPRKLTHMECAFCKNNGEQESYYTSHVLKDGCGRVLCPVLRAFRCPRCQATGDRAHTIKYCPESTESDHLPSIATLKHYRMQTGKRRTFGSLSPPSSPSGSPSAGVWSNADTPPGPILPQPGPSGVAGSSLPTRRNNLF